MNKTINTAIFILFGLSATAQKGIENMIRAEKDFAAYSLAHSTKEAFEQFIDSNSIMFDEGKPIKAIDFWNKREKRPGLLNWYPQFAEISASNDFGFTTGPWTWRATEKDTVAARGQYSTVWYLDKNENWKFLIDYGIDNTEPNNAEERIINVVKYPEDKNVITHIAPLVIAEKSFNELLAKNKVRAYEKWLSDESILTRNGFLPAHTSTTRKKIIEATPDKLNFKMDGWGVSEVPDMGYTYGSVTINEKPTNYMRIWRREKKGWRLALEVLRY